MDSSKVRKQQMRDSQKRLRLKRAQELSDLYTSLAEVKHQNDQLMKANDRLTRENDRLTKKMMY